MQNFQVVNHEFYPDDQYISESVTLTLDSKYRVTYVRKKMKNGGMFWDEVSCSVSSDGEKKYLKGFETDSNFLNKDIKDFLNKRGWEKKGSFDQNEGQMPF